MMGKKYFIPFCISMCCFSIYGQQNGKVYIDSLKGKSYEYFLEKLQVDEQDENSIVLSNVYLQKAKSEKNWKQMMNAYKIILVTMSLLFHLEKLILGLEQQFLHRK